MNCRWCHDTRLYQPLVGEAQECLECKPKELTYQWKFSGFETYMHQCFLEHGNQDCYSNSNTTQRGVKICTRIAGHSGQHATHGEPLRDNPKLREILDVWD